MLLDLKHLPIRPHRSPQGIPRHSQVNLAYIDHMCVYIYLIYICIFVFIYAHQICIYIYINIRMWISVIIYIYTKCIYIYIHHIYMIIYVNILKNESHDIQWIGLRDNRKPNDFMGKSPGDDDPKSPWPFRTWPTDKACGHSAGILSRTIKESPLPIHSTIP
jgi:hypothetical protein